MNKVQFIKTDSGEELAVLPKAEYERLVNRAEDEDAGTARIVRGAKQAIDAGREIVVPKNIVDRLAAGENPVRVLREWRHMTQMELVLALGITQGYLSDLETGKRKGPFALHEKISRALGVPLDLLTPVAVSNEEADPERFAKRKRVVAKMVRQRHRR
jgi:DNA-binding XRE family transcriptional regulator